MDAKDYSAFLDGKRERVEPVGFDVPDARISPRLFDWQAKIVQWALRRGRAALFEDCGLGKTAQQIEWARHVAEHSGRPVLILAPLAVADQTVREGMKFGVRVTKCATGSDVQPGVNVTNYEKLGKFSTGVFSGIVLDESSILKAYDGKTRKAITDFAQDIPFRLCCTATPAPNDFVELCKLNHSVKRYPYIPSLIIRVRPLCNMKDLRDFSLRIITVFAKVSNTLQIQYFIHPFSRLLQHKLYPNTYVVRIPDSRALNKN